MRIITALLALILFGAAFAGSAFQLVEHDAESGQWYAYCSGAVVERQGVTAGHCTQGLEPGARLYVRDGEGHVYPARLEARCFEWPSCDHSILGGSFVWLLDSLRLADELPQVGEACSYYGAPYGIGLYEFRGVYLGLVWAGNPQVDGLPLFDITSAGGSSGSILKNARGEAVAILVGGWLGQSTMQGVRMAPRVAFAVDLHEFM